MKHIKRVISPAGKDKMYLGKDFKAEPHQVKQRGASSKKATVADSPGRLIIN